METVIVPSLSRDGVGYRVSTVGGAYACGCPRFSFGKACAHTQILAAADRAAERCLVAGHEPRQAGSVCRACLVSLLAVAARKARRLRAETTRAVKADMKARRVAATERRKQRKQRRGA